MLASLDICGSDPIAILTFVQCVYIMPGDSGTVNNDQFNRTKWRTELYKCKSKGSKYKDDIKEPGLLSRWPKFMDLQVKLPEPGEATALVEMRKMCPGKPATLEEIKEISRETQQGAWLAQAQGRNKVGAS